LEIENLTSKNIDSEVEKKKDHEVAPKVKPTETDLKSEVIDQNRLKPYLKAKNRQKIKCKATKEGENGIAIL